MMNGMLSSRSIIMMSVASSAVRRRSATISNSSVLYDLTITWRPWRDSNPRRKGEGLASLPLDDRDKVVLPTGLEPVFLR